jgi:hypothetical protein
VHCNLNPTTLARYFLRAHIQCQHGIDYEQQLFEYINHKCSKHSHNDDKAPSSVGRVFPILFAASISVSRFGSIPISLGMVPESPLVSSDSVTVFWEMEKCGMCEWREEEATRLTHSQRSILPYLNWSRGPTRTGSCLPGRLRRQQMTLSVHSNKSGSG